MRLRVALAAALLCVIGALALDMSGSAPRLSGTNHVNPLAFVVTVPPGGRLCQPAVALPPDTGSVKLLIASYGRPLPTISALLTGEDGERLASGELARGRKQGYVTIPLEPVRQRVRAGTLCIRFGGTSKLAFGGVGEPENAASVRVNGHIAEAKVSLYYLRPGSESWWELLPTLAQRFGFGKAAFFGSWTLPLVAFLLLATWVATIRLLVKEAS